MHFRLTEARSSECCSLAKLMKTYKKSREIIRPHPTNVTLTGSLICSKTMFTSANSQTQYFIIFMTGNNQKLERAGEFDRRSKRPCSKASALRTFHLIKRMLATDVPCMRSNLSPAIITLFIQVIDAASPQMAIVRALFTQAILELKNSGVFSV